MSGAILHPNEEVQRKTKANIIRYYEIIEGKTALLKTWEDRGELCPEDIEYVNELKIKIRKARVLLSHIKA
jgi:hypothetical protein